MFIFKISLLLIFVSHSTKVFPESEMRMHYSELSRSMSESLRNICESVRLSTGHKFPSRLTNKAALNLFYLHKQLLCTELRPVLMPSQLLPIGTGSSFAKYTTVGTWTWPFTSNGIKICHSRFVRLHGLEFNWAQGQLFLNISPTCGCFILRGRII